MNRSVHSKETIARSKQMWGSVCRVRGTPSPDSAHVGAFLENLEPDAQATFLDALAMCANGREKSKELVLVSWAAACTRPALLAKVHGYGLDCTGAALFRAGLSLMDAGWDMTHRIAQMVQAPDDIESLRSVLALQPGPGAPASDETVVVPSPETTYPDTQEGLEDAGFDLFSEGRDCGHAIPPVANANSPTRDEWSQPSVPSGTIAPGQTSANPADRLQVRLFGKESTHTLEIGAHRRGSDFLGIHVVTVESARALPNGGYDWNRKLLIQFTPEEMPTAIAVLMGLVPSAKFAQHGSERNKFIELRRQEGGLMVVSGQPGANYAVPVKAPSVYYLLDLFCRAMSQGRGNCSVVDVLALVRSVHGSFRPPSS